MRRFAFSWSAVAIVALVGIAFMLTVAALRAPGDAPGTVPAPTGSALSDPPTVKAKPGKTVDVGVPDVEPLLSLVDRETAFRGAVGTCLGGSTMERTVDGGATWGRIKSPANALTQVVAGTSVVVSVVGAGEDCRAASWSSSTGGRTWNGPGATAGLWFRLPDSAKRIQTPSGTVNNPCDDPSVSVREIQGVDPSVGVLLCPDGEIRTTSNGGANWPQKSVVQGAVALAWDSPAEGWLLKQDSELCPGFQLVRTIDGGASWPQTGGCVGDASASAPGAEAPSLDFVNPTDGMATVEGAVFTTTDGGLTWRLAR